MHPSIRAAQEKKPPKGDIKDLLLEKELIYYSMILYEMTY